MFNLYFPRKFSISSVSKSISIEVCKVVSYDFLKMSMLISELSFFSVCMCFLPFS